MSNLEKRNQALVESLGGNDVPPSKEEKTEWLCGKFEFERQILARSDSWRLDKTDECLAFDAVEHLVALLQQGEATKSMQIMLADYLKKYVLDRNEKAARAILGMPKGGGRPTKKMREQRAIAAYETLIKAGRSEEDALMTAWQQYHPDKTFEEELKRPLSGGSSYHMSINNTIKPLLVDAGVREADPKKKRGAPTKLNPIKT